MLLINLSINIVKWLLYWFTIVLLLISILIFLFLHTQVFFQSNFLSLPIKEKNLNHKYLNINECYKFGEKHFLFLVRTILFLIEILYI